MTENRKPGNPFLLPGARQQTRREGLRVLGDPGCGHLNAFISAMQLWMNTSDYMITWIQQRNNGQCRNG
jgi:hypothetical protein